MRRTMTLVATAMLALTLAAGVAVAASLEGTAGNDEILGSDGPDGQGSDEIRGNQDSDELRGNRGEDAVFGGLGDDYLVSVGDGRGDLVDCGPGTDVVQSGPDLHEDRLVGCERLTD